MNGVYFGTIHSYNDLNLILAPFVPTPAEPKLNFLEIPGRDGHLDLTEANGEVKYNSREFEFIFTIAPGDTLTFDERVSAVSNALNGLRCKIILDRDPGYYWEGRCAVSEYDQDKNIGQIKVAAVVFPYKMKDVYTNGYITGTQNTDFSMRAGRMPLIPVFRCSSPFKIIFDGQEYLFAAGEHKNPNIRIINTTKTIQAALQDSSITSKYVLYLSGKQGEL